MKGIEKNESEALLKYPELMIRGENGRVNGVHSSTPCNKPEFFKT